MLSIEKKLMRHRVILRNRSIFDMSNMFDGKEVVRIENHLTIQEFL